MSENVNAAAANMQDKEINKSVRSCQKAKYKVNVSQFIKNYGILEQGSTHTEACF